MVKDLAARHPEEFAPQRGAEQVRNYLRSLGVGIDCAGAVQLALFDSHGLSPNRGERTFGYGRASMKTSRSSMASVSSARFVILPSPSQRSDHSQAADGARASATP